MFEGINEKVATIINLQEVDLELDALLSEREDLPRRIEALREELKDFEASIILDRERLEELEAERKIKEGGLRDEEEKLKKSEQKLTDVKTNKEYKAALKEIKDHRDQNSVFEDQILVIMEEIDSLNVEISRKLVELEKMSLDIKSEIESMTIKADEIEKELKIKEGERENLIAKIDTNYLNKYDTLAKKGRKPVIVRVKKGVCTGCFMNLPPQFFNEIQRDRDLKFCPNCSRMIYWHEETEEKTQEGAKGA